MILLFAMARLAVAAPPGVVEAIPDNGDVNVDPNLSEIRITFDQRMDTRGRSIVGGGESFPEIAGEIRWVGGKTIVIPVKLKPDHEYWLSINNQQYRNFANVRGESAAPYPIRFVTGGADDAITPADQRELNAAAVDRLRAALAMSYSYCDRTGVDWDGLLDDNRGALERTRTPRAFGRVVSTLLAKAEDKHVWVEVDGSRMPTYRSPPVPNVNPELLPEVVPGFERLSPIVFMGRWDDGVGYVNVASWDGANPEAVEAAFEALWRLHDARAIIVDVRMNGGGDETLAKAFAGCFIDEPVLYAKNRYVDPANPGVFGPVLDRIVEPSTRRPRFTGPVAVLSGPVVMSSNEAFVLMMKAAPRATVMGGTTQGSSGNPRPHDLGNGVTIWLPSWQGMDARGVMFEGVGIEPDIAVDAPPERLMRADPVLDAALEHLRE
ncbi:MAG: S41 family peptidase [Phycisphaerales bacterium]